GCRPEWGGRLVRAAGSGLGAGAVAESGDEHGQRVPGRGVLHRDRPPPPGRSLTMERESLRETASRQSPRQLRQFAGMWIVFFSAFACWQGFWHGHRGLSLLLAALAATVGPLGL